MAPFGGGPARAAAAAEPDKRVAKRPDFRR